LTDVEVIERRFPVRIIEFRIRAGSGGKGKNRGGDGVRRSVEFLSKLWVSVLSQRRAKYVPFGLEGGCTGALGKNTLQSFRGETRDLGGNFTITVEQGDVLTIETPGGGGFGTAAFSPGNDSATL